MNWYEVVVPILTLVIGVFLGRELTRALNESNKKAK